MTVEDLTPLRDRLRPGYDAIYIPLRTDWMPNGNRCTADGVEVLLGGRWPPEVDANQGARISGAVFGRVWGIVCDAAPVEDSKGISTYGLSRENDEQTANGAQDEAPEVAPEPVAGMDGGNERAVEPGVQSIFPRACISSPGRDVAVAVEVCPVILGAVGGI